MPRSSRVLFASALMLCASTVFPQEIPVTADMIVKIAEPVKTICWNRNDSLFALGEADSVIVRDAQSFDILHEFSFPQGKNLCFSRQEGRNDFYSDMLLGVSSENVAIWSLLGETEDARANEAGEDSSYKLSFGGMRAPVLFSADSRAVYGCKEENVVSLMALNGDTLCEVRVRSTVSQFTVTPDDKTLIVLTDEGPLEFYSLEDGEFVGYIPPFNESALISFAFSSDYKQVLTGHEDGSVYKLSVEDVLRNPDEPVPAEPVFDEGAVVVVPGQEHSGGEGEGSNEGASAAPRSQEQPAPFNFQSALRERFSAFNVGASALMLDKKSTYYQFGTAAEFDWYTTLFTAPVYEGLGARFGVAFPAGNWPTTYRTLDGSERIGPPALFFGEVFVPVGVEVPVGTFVSLFSEVAFEAKVSWLMKPRVTASRQGFSLGGRIRTGVVISKVAIILGAEYDSMWGLIPELSVMANFKLKGKFKAKGGKK